MKRVLVVIGTRPEAIKLCPLIVELRNQPEYFRTSVCATAQHRQMLDQVLRIFDVVPDYDLDLMKTNQTLFGVTSAVLLAMKDVFDQDKPDLVIVQGDTTTTFAASLAAYYSKIKLGHVEAGLRTGDKYSPFPEEMNRKLTTSLADIHFAPTEGARRNLLAENVPTDRIVVTGNTVIDALLSVRQKVRMRAEHFKSKFIDLDLNKKIILVTGHRRENFGQGMIQVCDALKYLATKYPNILIVYPVHMNPNVRTPVYDILREVENIRLIDPLEYESFIFMMDICYFIITDSGGIQEEAPSMGKPTLVTRTNTERPESVESNSVKLVGTIRDRIIEESQRLLDDEKYYKTISKINHIYGDGNACNIIVDSLKKYFFV
jgi:UDP-N-acetylglucosamine 2-epimerase (non-hydrolysing)